MGRLEKLVPKGCVAVMSLEPFAHCPFVFLSRTSPHSCVDFFVLTFSRSDPYSLGGARSYEVSPPPVFLISQE